MNQLPKPGVQAVAL